MAPMPEKNKKCDYKLYRVNKDKVSSDHRSKTLWSTQTNS